MTDGSESCSSSSRRWSYTSNSSYYSSSSAATSNDDSPPLALFQQLEKEIGSNIHLGVDLAKFAHEVWGIEKDAVDKILSISVAFDEAEKESLRVRFKDSSFVLAFL
ncbi:hypothetical protein NMY22_g8060 [Coprinellus aureogranulatus]|nr:hypothetical protein NMY22_g8060 [Coprinellus aureogranulatus]